MSAAPALLDPPEVLGAAGFARRTGATPAQMADLEQLRAMLVEAEADFLGDDSMNNNVDKLPRYPERMSNLDTFRRSDGESP